MISKDQLKKGISNDPSQSRFVDCATATDVYMTSNVTREMIRSQLVSSSHTEQRDTNRLNFNSSQIGTMNPSTPVMTAANTVGVLRSGHKRVLSKDKHVKKSFLAKK